MAATETGRVRDPIHGFIAYSAEEAKLVDSPPLQRLRGVKQLALTSLVYPGATHSRFEHSLGVMHIAGKIAERVGLSNPERRLVRLAALLHDVGHLPLSHAGEAAAIALTPGLRELGEDAHEAIGVGLIEHDGDIARALPKEQDRQAVLDILEKGARARQTRPPTPILWQIVAGPLDADKLDYLLRDSLMAGVKYGVFDIDRMIDAFVPHGTGRDRHLAVRWADLPCVEQAILARYYMTQQVYRHQVRRITDAMLKHAVIAAGSQAGAPASRIAQLFRYRPAQSTWRSAFLSSSDASVVADLAEAHANTKCGKLGRRLLRRHLLKQVFECRIPDIPGAGVAWRERLVREPERQGMLALRLARALGADSHLVLVDVRQRSNPLYRDPGLPLEQDIRVLHRSGRDERLGDVEGSLSQKVRVEEEADLYVYAPADTVTTRERNRMSARVRRELSRAAEEGRP
jgi:HD superfamily phosphohydrolase